MSLDLAHVLAARDRQDEACSVHGHRRQRRLTGRGYLQEENNSSDSMMRLAISKNFGAERSMALLIPVSFTTKGWIGISGLTKLMN